MNLPDPDRTAPAWNDPRHAEIDLAGGQPEILEAAALLASAFRQVNSGARSSVESNRLVIWTRLTPEDLEARDAAQRASTEAWEARKAEQEAAKSEAEEAFDRQMSTGLGLTLDEFLAVKSNVVS